MSRKLNADIDAWAHDMVRSLARSGFSGINTVEKLLRDPGRATDTSPHRILWWPRNQAVSRISRMMHQIDPVSQICLIVNSGWLLNGDGTIFGVLHLKRYSSLSVREIRERVRDARRKLREIEG